MKPVKFDSSLIIPPKFNGKIVIIDVADLESEQNPFLKNYKKLLIIWQATKYPVYLSLIKNLKNNCCPICGNAVVMDYLRNEKSKKEFLQSAMCQECQDGVFGID